MMFIPHGFAHGFQTLVDKSEVFYLMSEFYHPESARGLRWDDPMLGITWPLANQIISDKDRTYPLIDTGHHEKPIMRILLIGATGQLGSDLIKNNPGHHIIAPAKTELDVTRSDTITAAIRDSRADWVINTAAFHNVPLCEEQPEQAFRVNCVAVRDLALACEHITRD